MLLEKIDSKTGDGGRKRSKGEAGTLGVKWYGKERETGETTKMKPAENHIWKPVTL